MQTGTQSQSTWLLVLLLRPPRPLPMALPCLLRSSPGVLSAGLPAWPHTGAPLGHLHVLNFLEAPWTALITDLELTICGHAKSPMQ